MVQKTAYLSEVLESDVSRCLQALAQVTVKSLSGRSVLSPLLAPVMSLAASVVAEPLVSATFSAFRIRSGQGKYATAVLTAGKFAARGHEPVHLQIHRPQQILVLPPGPHVGGYPTTFVIH